MAKGSNPIVNSGDAHGYWISSIKDKAFTGTSNVAVEFAGGSVTSQGWGDYFPTSGGPNFGYTLGASNNPWLEMLEDGFVAANARYGEVNSVHKHGSLVFHVTKDTYIGQVMSVDTINGTGYHAMCESAYSVAAAVKGALASVPCVTKVSGTVPGKFVQSAATTAAQNGVKLTSSAKPAASGLAGSVFMAALTGSVTAKAAAPAMAPPVVAASGASATSASLALLASAALALVLF